MNSTFEFLQPNSDIIKHDNLELLNKCKRITRERIEGVTTEEELTKLRNEAGDRANRFWVSSQNLPNIVGATHFHHLWMEEDLVWKLLTECIYEAFPLS